MGSEAAVASEGGRRASGMCLRPRGALTEDGWPGWEEGGWAAYAGPTVLCAQGVVHWVTRDHDYFGVASAFLS